MRITKRAAWTTLGEYAALNNVYACMINPYQMLESLAFPLHSNSLRYQAFIHVNFYFMFAFAYRLEGKHLPLPPAMNGTQWGQATMARNLEKNCPSNKPCSNVICPEPFECVDLWNEYECT